MSVNSVTTFYLIFSASVSFCFPENNKFFLKSHWKLANFKDIFNFFARFIRYKWFIKPYLILSYIPKKWNLKHRKFHSKFSNLETVSYKTRSENMILSFIKVYNYIFPISQNIIFEFKYDWCNHEKNIFFSKDVQKKFLN